MRSSVTEPQRCRLLLAIAGAMLSVASTLHASSDAKAGSNSGNEWSVQITSYVWGSGLEGEVAPREGIPSTDIDASFTDLIENADLAVMLLVEVRKGRFGMLADLTYLSVEVDDATPGPLFGDAKLESETLTATLDFAYRAIERDNWALDLIAGVRGWDVEAELSLGAGILPAVEAKLEESWIDPLVGLRSMVRFGSGFSLATYADIGGFGAGSDLTWQVLGSIQYEFNDSLVGHLGYRHLSVDYEDDGFIWDVDMSGPLVGLSFRF